MRSGWLLSDTAGLPRGVGWGGGGDALPSVGGDTHGVQELLQFHFRFIFS